MYIHIYEFEYFEIKYSIHVIKLYWKMLETVVNNSFYLEFSWCSQEWGFFLNDERKIVLTRQEDDTDAFLSGGRRVMQALAKTHVPKTLNYWIPWYNPNKSVTTCGRTWLQLNLKKKKKIAWGDSNPRIILKHDCTLFWRIHGVCYVSGNYIIHLKMYTLTV